MKNLLKISILCFVISIISCTPTQKISSVVQDDQKISFTFLQLNDVYEISPLEGGKSGGLARVETIHQSLLSKNKNTFMFMAGDFLNPSLIGTMKLNGKRIRGEQMVETMNAMHFDLVTFGNHEFDIKENEVQDRLDQSTFPWVSSNCRHRVCDQNFPFHIQHNGFKTFVPDTYIIDAVDNDGTAIKIGFFSVTLNSNQKDYVHYNDIYEEAKRAYNYLNERTDLVIGFTHVEIEDDKKIAAMLPNVPLIMGGHEHYNMLEKVGNTYISKADANAKTVYVHDFVYDKKTKQYTLKSTLIPINDKIVPNPKVQAVVTKWEAVLDNKVRTIVDEPYKTIMNATIPLDGRDIPTRSTQTNLGVLIAESLRVAFDKPSDASFMNGGSIRLDDQLSGNITPIDFFRALPFGGSAYQVEMTGDLLIKTLDFGAKSIGNGAYLQRSKLDFDDVKKHWLINGKPIQKGNTYLISVTDFLLSGYDIPFLKEGVDGLKSVYKPKMGEKAYDIRKAVIELVKSKS